MKALRKTRPERGAELVDIPVPEVGPDEVLVKVKAAAICGTDIHIYAWNDYAQQRIKPPMTFGHEICAEVVQVGARVSHLKVGDQIAAETHIPCGHCYQCRIGNAHNCLNMKLLGLTWDGVFAEYQKVPANVCFPLPESIPMEIGALFEPAGVSVHALQRAGNVAANSAIVCGAGPVGLVVIQLLMLYGATRVVALDLNPYRLKLAEKLGAIPIDPRTTDVPKFCQDTFRHTGGVDVAFETSGSSSVHTMLFESLRREGRMVTVGHPGKEVAVDVAAYINKKGITLSGIFGRRVWDTWETLLALLESGRLDLSWIITHRLPFEDFGKGIELLSGDAAKVILHP